MSVLMYAAEQRPNRVQTRPWPSMVCETVQSMHRCSDRSTIGLQAAAYAYMRRAQIQFQPQHRQGAWENPILLHSDAFPAAFPVSNLFSLFFLFLFFHGRLPLDRAPAIVFPLPCAFHLVHLCSSRLFGLDFAHLDRYAGREENVYPHLTLAHAKPAHTFCVSDKLSPGPLTSMKRAWRSSKCHTLHQLVRQDDSQ